MVAVLLDDAHDRRLAWGAIRLQMSGPHDDDDTDVEDKSYPDKVRSQMDTKDSGAIMARFFRVVSWGDN